MSLQVHHFRFSAMGCPCELRLEAGDQRAVKKAAAAARAEVERLDRKYSHYRNDSLVADIGASADAGVGIELDEETCDLLDFSTTLHQQSQGRFDISAGGLTRLWDAQMGIVPGPAQVQAMRERCGWQHVSWQRPHLRLGVAGMRLDLGGVVKEYAADRAAQTCREAGVGNGVVDLGGDLAVIGAHVDGQPWLAGIKTPSQTDQVFARIPLASGGLATSGDYERVTIVDGRRYSHIIDARSGYPVESFASVSVVAPTCLVAGAASTLGMLLGPQAGYTWLRELGLPFLCIDAHGAATGTLATG
jgi:FAD:protein FMN transferase